MKFPNGLVVNEANVLHQLAHLCENDKVVLRSIMNDDRLYRIFLRKETTSKNLILKISSLILLRRKLEKFNFEVTTDLLIA